MPKHGIHSPYMKFSPVLQARRSLYFSLGLLYRVEISFKVTLRGRSKSQIRSEGGEFNLNACPTSPRARIYKERIEPVSGSLFTFTSVPPRTCPCFQDGVIQNTLLQLCSCFLRFGRNHKCNNFDRVYNWRKCLKPYSLRSDVRGTSPNLCLLESMLIQL